MKIIAAAVTLICAGIIALPARAWSEPSHMTTGAIAFDDLLRSSPDVLTQLQPILDAHPHRAGFAVHLRGLTGEARTRVLFMWLARWADDIRGTAYDNPEWHYELRVISPWASIWPFRNGTAREGFAANYSVLADASAAPAARAVALGWLLHIVGDIQQPLHAAHWASWTYPRTDRAGTLGFVRRTAGGAPVNLHQYWDKIFDRGTRAADTANAMAVPLQRQWPRTRITELGYRAAPQPSFDHWLDESLALGRRAAYADAFLRATPVPADAPAVSARYRLMSENLAARRIATGGYRIANVIRTALGANQP